MISCALSELTVIYGLLWTDMDLLFHLFRPTDVADATMRPLSHDSPYYNVGVVLGIKDV